MRFPGLESVGWALLNSLWQMGLLALLYQFITAGDRRFSAKLRHNIALAFSVAGALAFLYGLFYPSAQVELPVVLQSAGSAEPAESAPLFSGTLHAIDRLVALLPFLYAAILLLRTANAVFAVYTRRKFPEAVQGDFFAVEWNGFLERCRRRLGVGRAVILRWTNGPGMARTYGFFRPVILFPVALLSHLTVDQIEAILVHELAHIRRNDYLTHLWMSLFRFLFYFNPFAVFLYNAVDSEREKACDDLVLAHAYPASVYAHALVTLEQFRQISLSASLAASGRRPLQLTERIRRIAGLPAEAPSGPRNRVLMAVLLAAIICAGFGPVLHQLQKKDKARPAVLVAAVPVKTDIPDLKITVVVPGTGTPLVAEAAPAVPPPPVPLPAFEKRPKKENRLVLPDDTPGNAPDDATLEDPAPEFLQEATDEVNAESEGIDSATMVQERQNADGADIVIRYEPAFASKNIVRSFTYRNPATPGIPSRAATAGKPYVPSASFEFPVTDSVPAIALQSLRQNKPAVVELLAKWKALQLQQNISRALESRYLQLKQKTRDDIHALPAKKDELKKSLQNLQKQMKIRKAEMDRLSSVLAEEPVIYI